jgi:hypothetical protein
MSDLLKKYAMFSPERQQLIEDAMTVVHQNYRAAGRASTGMVVAVWVQSKIINDLARQEYTVLQYFD